VLVLHEKAVELAETEPVELFQREGYRHADDEGASPTRADESDTASLPKAQDGKPVDVKGVLMQGEAHLRLLQVKREANRRHSPVAL
jgi:hypothetical protein